MFHETLAAAIETAEIELADSRAITSENWQEKFQFGGMVYGQRKEVHFELDTLKGKATRKYGHVVIERMDSGRYELIVYCL